MRGICLDKVFWKKKISESQDLQSNYVVTHIAGFLGKCSKFYEKSSNKLDHIQVSRSWRSMVVVA